MSQPMEQAKHTPGAERAAEEIWNEAKLPSVEFMADVISRETHDAEMLETLKLMVEFYEDADHDEEAKAFPTANCPICRAKVVIAKAEGRQ